MAATHNRNFRETGDTVSTLAIAENMPYVVPLSDTDPIDVLNGGYANYRGGAIDPDLAGGAVIAVYADNRWITEFKPLEKTLELHPYEVTVEDGKYIYKGEALPIDDLLATSPASRVAYMHQGIYWARKAGDGKSIADKNWGLASNGDDNWELFDTDGDGDYDFATMCPIFNASLVAKVEGNLIAVQGSYGSPASIYTWAEGTSLVEYEFACEPFEIKAGDRIDYRYSYNLETETPHAFGAPAKILIYGKSEMHTGTLTAVSNTGNVLDITCTIGGVEYKWSDTIITNDENSDGENGNNAGRYLMTEENIGKEFNFYLDRAGQIVLAKLNETDEGGADYYVVLATWTDNIRLRANGRGPTVTTPFDVAVVKLGDEVNADKATILPLGADFAGELKMGAIYTFTLNDAGELTAATQVGADTALSMLIGDFGWDAEAKKATNKGVEFALDTAKLEFEAKNYTFWFDGVNMSTTTLTNLGNAKADNMLTFYDVNADGKYDFVFNRFVLSGRVAEVHANGSVSISGTYGSAESSGWYQAQGKYFYTAPEGVTFAAGDIINFTVRLDKSIADYKDDMANSGLMNGNFPPMIEVIAVATKVTGVAENVIADSAASITFTMNGVNYEWSNQLAKHAYADLEDGTNAGRTTFTSGNSYNIYLDNAGYVVYAEYAD